MLPVDGDFILRVAPRFSGDKAEAQARIVSAISGHFARVLDQYQINTVLRIAHFMGQVTHECAGFRTTEEFASGDAYEGRADLGNTQTGDGRKYKGRGLLQLTGRFNYRSMGQKLNLPLEAEPLRAGDPLTSLLIACEYWKDRKINDPADADDLVAVTRRVNGGTNGLEDRRGYLQKAKAALAEIQGIAIGVDQGGTVTILRRGSNSDAVGELQTLLRAKGFSIAVDNDFGAATELAVKQFQQQSGLTVDGIVGRDTWAALRRQSAPRRRAA
jgi:putative chitinase